MPINTNCTTVASSRIKRLFVSIEETSGVLQKPTAADFVMPTGEVSINQTPEYTNSEELTGTLDVMDQFKNAVQPGECSIPMYVRLPRDGSRPQGHALLHSMMGRVQEPGTVTVTLGSAAADATALTVTASAGGTVPRRGVLTTAGGEKIQYHGVTVDDSGAVIALTGCVRGYAQTTAVDITDGDTAMLTSRVYLWDNCRPSLSVWLLIDHTLVFGSGAVVTQGAVPMSREGGQHCDFTLQFRRMGWCGRSFLRTAPAGGVLTVETVEGKDAVQAYTEGGYLKNTTKADDNGGAGYQVTAVDKESNTITVSPMPVGWEANDRLDPWLPEGNPIGEVVESGTMRVFVDDIAGKLTQGTITIGTPTSFVQEIGDEYPGENADNLRELTMDNGLYFRAKDAVELGRGYEGYALPVNVVMGGKAGHTLSLAMPRVRFQSPTIADEDVFVTLTRQGAIMGVKGNDSLQIIQE